VTRAQLRTVALEQDWNRLRDYEREWRIFGERVGRVVVLIVAVWLLATWVLT
jgi:hypothetical protein